jgi:hypothetical protein
MSDIATYVAGIAAITAILPASLSNEQLPPAKITPHFHAASSADKRVTNLLAESSLPCLSQRLS